MQNANCNLSLKKTHSLAWNTPKTNQLPLDVWFERTIPLRVDMRFGSGNCAFVLHNFFAPDLVDKGSFESLIIQIISPLVQHFQRGERPTWFMTVRSIQLGYRLPYFFHLPHFANLYVDVQFSFCLYTLTFPDSKFKIGLNDNFFGSIIVIDQLKTGSISKKRHPSGNYLVIDIRPSFWSG